MFGEVLLSNHLAFYISTSESSCFTIKYYPIKKCEVRDVRTGKYSKVFNYKIR